MKKLCLILFFATVLPVAASPQETADMLLITGCTDAEELSGQTVERFEALSVHPVEINLSSRQRLMSSGLFSAYQAVSIIDYRSRYGDILSVSELAAVDGIGKELALALSGFVSFYSASLPGSVPRRRTVNNAVVRAAGKSGKLDLKGKYRISSGRFEGGAAVKKGDPFARTFYISVTGRKFVDRVVVGDFSARFGQGLSMWTGMSMTGSCAPSSLYKRSHGFTPAWSYSDMNLRGAAVSLSVNRLNISSFAASSRLRVPFMDRRRDRALPSGVNLTWFGRGGQAGITAMAYGRGAARVSADFRICLQGTEIFAETSADLANRALASVGGAVFSAGRHTGGLLLRYYPARFAPDFAAPVRAWTKASDEAGATLSWQYSSFVANCDVACHPSAFGSGETEGQVKLQFAGSWDLSRRLVMKVRLSERLRSCGLTDRTDLRTDFCWTSGPWSVNARLNGLHSRKTSFLAYLEPCWKRQETACYFRLTVFAVDSWDDRIYSYERDAPGNFNVPAYYGRGFSMNLNLSAKRRIRGGTLKSYLAAGMVRYPWMDDRKPGTHSLRVQIAYDF